MIIPGNYYRYFIVERKFRQALLVLALLASVLAYQIHVIQQKRTHLEEATRRQQLVMKIPAMEKALKDRMAQQDLPVSPPPAAPPTFEETHILRGTIDMDGITFAVIDDAQYKIGDVIDGHVILKIDITGVELIDSATQQIKVLRLK